MTRIKQYVTLLTFRIGQLLSGDSFAYSCMHFGLLQFIWGLWVAVAGTFTGVVAYGPMAELASGFTWGLIAMLIGGAKITHVLHRNRISLTMVTLMGGFFWSIVGVSFLIADPPNTGGVVYLMLALYDFWLYKRLGDRRS